MPRRERERERSCCAGAAVDTRDRELDLPYNEESLLKLEIYSKARGNGIYWGRFIK